MNLTSEQTPIKRAIKDIIIQGDFYENEAKIIIELYDSWATETDYMNGQIISYDGNLFEIITDHISNIQSLPVVSPDIYRLINPIQ